MEERKPKDNTKLYQGNLGYVAYNFVLAGDFSDALEAADTAIQVAPADQIWIQENRAHALMFLGRADEARKTYLQYQGSTPSGLEGKLWRDIILEDFTEMRNAGLNHPLMDEIENAFTLEKTSEPSEAQPGRAAP